MKFFNIFLYIFLSINYVHAYEKNSEVEYIDFSEPLVSELLQSDRHEFIIKHNKFQCFPSKVFDEKSEVIVSGKDRFLISDILPRGKNFQCWIFSTQPSSQFPGSAHISVKEIKNKKYASGLISIGHKNYYLPPLTPVSKEGTRFFTPKPYDNYDQKIDSYSQFSYDSNFEGKKEKFDYPPVPKPEDLPPPDSTPSDKKRLREITIDIETDAKFLEQFRADDEDDYQLAIQRALVHIENLYSQVRLINSRDFGIAVKVGRVYLYEAEDPWYGFSRLRILNDIKLYWRGGRGWVYQDSVGEGLDLIEGVEPSPTDITENGVDLFQVAVEDNRPGSGEKRRRIENEGVALVQILSGVFQGGSSSAGHSDINNANATIGNINSGFSIAGAKNVSDDIEYDILFLEEVIDLTERVASGSYYNLIAAAHELGHSFGLLHTHSRQVDQCYCEPRGEDDDSCDDFEPSDEIGYIMSYCREYYMAHDDHARALIGRQIRSFDRDFLNFYLPRINNTPPEIRSVFVPILYNTEDEFTVVVQADDIDNDKLFYKYEFNNGLVIYSDNPRINFNFNQDIDQITVTVYDEKMGSSQISKEISNRYYPENIKLSSINDDQISFDPAIVYSYLDSFLNLSFYNYGGSDVTCSLTLPNGEILIAEPLNDPSLDWNVNCMFRHHFEEAGEYEISSTIEHENLDPIVTHHTILVRDNNIKIPPRITNITLIEPGRRFNEFGDQNPIDYGDIQGTISTQVTTFNPDGDITICHFDMGNGRTINVISDPIDENPNVRICSVNIFRYFESGPKQIRVSAYSESEIPILDSVLRDGIDVRFMTIRNFDVVNGFRWIDFNVNRPNEPEPINIDEIEVIDSISGNHILPSHLNVPKYVPIEFTINYSGDNFEEVGCSVLIDGRSYSDDVTYLETRSQKKCKISHIFYTENPQEIRVRLINLETGRPINITQVRFDDDGNVITDNAGTYVSRVNPQVNNYPHTFSFEIEGSQRVANKLRPISINENTTFNLTFTVPDNYQEDEDRLFCVLEINNNEIRVESHSIDRTRIYRSCNFNHTFDEEGVYLMRYQISWERRGLNYSDENSRGEESVKVYSEEIPAVGEMFRLINHENGRSQTLPIDQTTIFSEEEITLGYYVYQNFEDNIRCELNKNRNQILVTTPVFNPGSNRGWCLFNLSFPDQNDDDFYLHEVRYKAKRLSHLPEFSNLSDQDSKIIRIEN